MLSADQWRRYAAQIEKWGTPTHVGPTAGDCEDVVALLEAARDAEKQFRWYGDLHAQKKAYDKANRNYKFADKLTALLPQTGEGEGADHANVEPVSAEEVARIGLVPRSEVERLQDTLERERSQVATGIGAVKEAIRKREWLRLGRGSFEWDDERWKDEFGHAIDEILQAMEPLRSIACDWSDCPTDRERIKRARETAPAIDGELLRSLLAEGFHTAFRKASQHKLSSQIHSLIGDLPQREWGEVIEFVAYGLESSFAAGHSPLPAPMSEGERDSGIDAFLSDVRAEFHRGRAKFPGNELKTVALSEEFGELVKAVLDEAAADVRKEAVQVAAMCLRLVIDGDSSVDGWRERNGLDALSKREDGS